MRRFEFSRIKKRGMENSGRGDTYKVQWNEVRLVRLARRLDCFYLIRGAHTHTHMQLLATLYLVLDPVQQQQQQLEKAEVIAFSLLAALFLISFYYLFFTPERMLQPLDSPLLLCVEEEEKRGGGMKKKRIARWMNCWTAVRRRSETRRLRLKLVQAAEMTSVLGPDPFFFWFLSFHHWKNIDPTFDRQHVMQLSGAPTNIYYSYSVVENIIYPIGTRWRSWTFIGRG